METMRSTERSAAGCQMYRIAHISDILPPVLRLSMLHSKNFRHGKLMDARTAAQKATRINSHDYSKRLDQSTTERISAQAFRMESGTAHAQL